MRELLLTNCRLDKRYDVWEQLGRGSYAEVFCARDIAASPSSPHNQVVIKALNVFLQDDLDADLERTLVENFQNEAIALDRVRHPNIISRLGHGTARDLNGVVFHYLVIEYMAGGDLQKACRERTLDPKKAVAYLEQVCAGLRHAHRHGVIHRDIKPQNLLLSQDKKTVKIGDFGVARMTHSQTPITRVGTNVYAPPEHSPLSAGNSGTERSNVITPSADIYSLAKSLYTMMTGEAPRYFAGQQITELPGSARDAVWADELRRVLKKATADEPDERHRDVDEFWLDLDQMRQLITSSGRVARITGPLRISPQPHVARGYSPLAPREPRFSTSQNLKLRFPLIPAPTGNAGVITELDHALPNEYVAPSPAIDEASPLLIREEASAQPVYVPAKKKRKGILRRAATFLFVLALFAGVLYGTSVYLRGLGFLPRIGDQSSVQSGRANTDINLRPEPSVNNDPIGLVTKNSKVRIVKIQNNWYQVDVVEQGRQRDQGLDSTHGWLNGKYVDLDN
ncbi:MAG: serine/threonine protein kinase [Acidobacteriota bacterium]